MGYIDRKWKEVKEKLLNDFYTSLNTRVSIKYFIDNPYNQILIVLVCIDKPIQNQKNNEYEVRLYDHHYSIKGMNLYKTFFIEVPETITEYREVSRYLLRHMKEEANQRLEELLAT